MLFHVERTPAPTPTMTAALAAGDSSPPFYIGANLASTMEDNKGWVLSVPRSRSAKISTLTSHGTYHAIAAPVENFPSLPLDNRRHEPNRSATATAPSPLQHTMCSIDATHACQSFDPDEGFSPIVCKCPFAFCRGTCPTAASLWKTTRTISCSSISPTEDAQSTQQPTRVPVDLADLQAQIRANMTKLGEIFTIHGRRPINTLVLNFYAVSRRKNTRFDSHHDGRLGGWQTPRPFT